MSIVKKQIVTSTTTETPRRAYQTPKLTEFGAVRHLTQGGTAGLAEDGNQNMNFMV